GVDIVVSNAGIASSAPIGDTTLEEWQRNQAVLGTGYFLVAREAFRVLQGQDRGGSIVFVASKNALVAGPNASAYSSAKAAELHLARCLAEEGGAAGIRVNTVNPDAVLQGSRIWDSSWREERAAAYGIAPDELEEHYRSRTVLGVNILPEDIAQAVLHFSSPVRSGKSTGNMLNVDGGVTAAYPGCRLLCSSSASLLRRLGGLHARSPCGSSAFTGWSSPATKRAAGIRTATAV